MIQVEEILFEEGKNQCLKGSKNLCLKKKEQRDSHVCQDLGSDGEGGGRDSRRSKMVEDMQWGVFDGQEGEAKRHRQRS